MELWFDLASNYSYLTLMRIDPLAEQAGVSVRWEPFLLGPVFEAFGWKSSPFVLQKEKGAYVWRSIGAGPVLDTPLAVCDARSVRPEDLVTTELRYPDRTG